MGASAYAGALSLQNLKNLFDDDAATVGKSPMLSFTLDTVPTGSGTATIKATIIDGKDGTRTGTENEISLEVDVSYIGDGTDATITAKAGAATGSYTKGDGSSVSFTVDNGVLDTFSISKNIAADGTTNFSTLDVKLEALYDAFITGAGRSDLLVEGTYSVALETTLPLENYANETVTKFTTTIELYDGTDMKNSIVGTNGADTIVGTSAAEVIIMGAGTDTISTGAGADYIILSAGQGSTTLANANTMTGHLTEPSTGTSGFTNGVDKFALGLDASGNELTFADLSVDGANSNADTVVSITASGEYLMTITGLQPGYVLTDDFVSTDDIV
jgi:Ca2+-binding RTX toxin-like protein